MQVWNLLHAARWKCTNTGRKKVAKNRHLGTIPQLCRAISSQLKHVSTIGNKLVKQQYLVYMSPQHAELRPNSGWDHLVSLGHSSSGRQPNSVALNRGRHLCSPGRPSRWVLAHILVFFSICSLVFKLRKFKVTPSPNCGAKLADFRPSKCRRYR